MVQSSPPRHTSINMYKYLLSLNVLYNLGIANKKTRVINIVVLEENVHVLSAQILSDTWFTNLEMALKERERPVCK